MFASLLLILAIIQSSLQVEINWTPDLGKLAGLGYNKNDFPTQNQIKTSVNNEGPVMWTPDLGKPAGLGYNKNDFPGQNQIKTSVKNGGDLSWQFFKTVLPQKPSQVAVDQNEQLADFIKQSGENIRNAMREGTNGFPKLEPAILSDAKFSTDVETIMGKLKLDFVLSQGEIDGLTNFSITNLVTNVEQSTTDMTLHYDSVFTKAMFAITGFFLGNPTQESGWFSLNLENLNTNIFFDLDNLTEEIPNLDSLKIGIDVGKAYLLGRATSSEDQNLDMDITEIFNNVKNLMLNNTMPAIHSKIRHEFSNCTGAQLGSGDFSCVLPNKGFVPSMLSNLAVCDYNIPE